jgi:hypothetical protein
MTSMSMILRMAMRTGTDIIITPMAMDIISMATRMNTAMQERRSAADGIATQNALDPSP